jgi:NADH-quinone oxidoreductase subunit L
MNKFSFTFIISSFYRVLFNVFFGKHRKISFWDHWNSCCFISLFWLQLISSEQLLLILRESKFHFSIDSNQQFQGRFWFSIRPIIHFMVTVCNRNSLIHMYSISYMHDENMHKYFAYLNLFIFFMITLVIK